MRRLTNFFVLIWVSPFAHAATINFPTDCQSLAFEEFGPDSGKPIVLLAGGPGMNPAYMTPVAKMLADAGRHVILLHQRGTGKSPVGCPDHVTLAGAIADLEQLRAYLKLSQLTIAGHSWGGMLAMAYTEAHPDKVAGLLLIDTGPMEQSGFATENEIMHKRMSPADQASLKSPDTPMGEKEKIMRRASFADPAKASLIDASVPPGESLWNVDTMKMLSQRSIDKWDVTAGMKKFTAPLALIVGREDPGFFIAAQIQAHEPQASVTVIDHAGHYPWLENINQTLAALKSAADKMP